MISGKRISLVLLSLAIVCIISATPARADIVIAGSTTGCFGANCTPAPHPAPLLDLTFSGGCFGCVGSPGTNNIGTFTLGNLPADYNGQTFTLLVNFLGPTNPNPATFTATLTGGVDSLGNGSLLIHFIDSPRIFGSIDFGLCSRCTHTPVQLGFYLYDLTLSPGQSVNLTSNVVVIPEPTTLFLLGTGLAGLAARHRRRRLNR
jgi:hypothetical protein